MPFWKKSSPDKVPVASEEKTLYPVLHIINCLKDYRNELVQKEVSSLSEISEIGHSFELPGKATGIRKQFLQHRGSIRPVQRREGYHRPVRRCRTERCG